MAQKRKGSSVDDNEDDVQATKRAKVVVEGSVEVIKTTTTAISRVAVASTSRLSKSTNVGGSLEETRKAVEKTPQEVPQASTNAGEGSSSQPVAGPSKPTKKSKSKGKGKTTSSESQAPENSTTRPPYKYNTLPPGHTLRKLAPQRPFPIVAPSVNATGPRSAHHEGKNMICVTRKTPLGMYLRRCKEIVMKDGYKTLHLHAMGPAINHLLTVAVSLPAILPYPPEDVHVAITTGTVDVRDEIIPDDEEKDIECRVRSKSSLSAVIKIGEGDPELPVKAALGANSKTQGGSGQGKPRRKRTKKTGDASGKKAEERDPALKVHPGIYRRPQAAEEVVYREADMDDDDEDEGGDMDSD